MSDNHCDIAIVGMGLHFPGADSPEQYWKALQRGEDLARPMDEKRRKVSLNGLISPQTKADAMRCDRGYFLNALPTPQQLDLPEGTDPLFVLALSTAEQALKDAGKLPSEQTGVIMASIALPTDTTSALSESTLGRSFAESLQAKLPPDKASAVSPAELLPCEYTFLSSVSDSSEQVKALNNYPVGLPAQLIASRFSLGLGAYTLDAACASSLVAIELACRELRSGRAEAMLAGGLSRPDCLYTQMGFSALHALSPSGACSPFDKKADGLMVGEGCGLVVLKRLKDAERSGDKIYGVIKGTGLSNDIEGSLVAPANEGQIRCLRDAYQICGLKPWDIDFIECHGTGTPVGDSIEFKSLQTLWEGAPESSRCQLRSVKSMLGHLLTAAGSAGLIRVLLNLQKGQITPQVNFNEAGIPLKESHFEISNQSVSWPKKAEAPRRAAVSGFGFGGINAHLIIEEYLPQTACEVNSAADARATASSAPASAEESENGEEAAAIIGMACRLGQIGSIRELAGALLDGNFENAKISPEPSAQTCEKSRQGGAFLNKVDIPIGRFRIPPADLPSILPQQSLLLNTAAEAMLDAGQPLRLQRERAAAVIGINLDLNSTNFNLRWLLKDKAEIWAQNLGLDENEAKRWQEALKDEISEPLDAVKTIGALGSIAASRAAREFRFGGCSFTVSSQELSGFDALQIGAEALLNRRQDLILVGSIDLQGDPRLASCRLKDEPMPEKYGEGSCCLVLKRYSDAVKDGDHIYALIKGLAKAGAAAPEKDSYTALETALRQACEYSGTPAEDIAYLETVNGQYLSQGPQSACQTLRRVLDRGTKPLSAGSIEDYVGHNGANSFTASLIKTALCLDQELWPASRHFDRLCGDANDWRGSRFTVQKTSSFWFRNRAEGPRRALVCGRAYPGQYAAAVLEEHFSDAYRPLAAPQLQIGIWPFFGENAQAITAKLSAVLEKTKELQSLSASASEQSRLLRNLCLDNYRREKEEGASRLCLAIASDRKNSAPLAEFQKQLETALQHLQTSPEQELRQNSIFYSAEPLAKSGKTAFVYPGSGANFLGLGREFALNFLPLMHRFDRENLYMAGEFAAKYNQPLRLDWSEGWQQRAVQELQADTHHMMSSQVSFAMLTTDIARSLGIEPNCAIGYSLGESSALFSLRAWPDRDKMYLRMEGSDLFREKLSGKCTAARQAWHIPENAPFSWSAALLPVPADKVKEALKNVKNARLLIINTDKECVVGGTPEGIDELCALLHTKAIKVSGVDTVHCDCLEPAAEEYWHMHHLPCQPLPGVEFYSGCKNCAYPLTSENIADSIVSHGRYGFDYTKTIRRAWEDGARIFLEMGPGSSCARMIRSILRGKPHFAISLSGRGQSEMFSLAQFLAGVLSQGLRPDLSPFFPSLQAEKAEKTTPTLTVPLSRRPCDPPLPAFPKALFSEGTNTAMTQKIKTDLTLESETVPVETAKPAEGRTLTEITALSAAEAASVPDAPKCVCADPLQSLLMQLARNSNSAHRKWLEFVGQSAKVWENLLVGQSSLISQAAAGNPQLFREPLTVEKPSEAAPVLSPAAQFAPHSEDKDQTHKEHGYTHKLHGIETTADGGYICGFKPSLAPPDQKVFLNRRQCLEFATGKIGDVLGEQFAPIDSYAARVRLPAEPLMLVDRIVSIEGEPLSLGAGRIITEHDVVPDMWYLDGNRAPVFISVEAGQADLFLCSWLGIDFQAKGDRVYRLLDANVKFHRGLPQPSETVRYDIRIKRFINQGETWLFFFEYEGTINGETFLTMRDGCAGFFTQEEIRNNGGLVMTEASLRPQKGKKGPEVQELTPLSASSYTLEQVEALRRGDLEGCFGAAFAGLNLKKPVSLPAGLLRLIHRIPECDPFGGRWGLGKVVAEADVHPEDWYLTCHFIDDMVMPGTLMYECCAHALRFLLTRFGWVGEQDKIAYEPVLGVTAVLKCRGPVLQTTKTVRYQVEIKEMGYNPAPYVIADAIMYADNKRIVGFENVSMQLTGTTGEELEKLWAERSASSQNAAIEPGSACTDDCGDPRAANPGDLSHADGRLGLLPAYKNVTMNGDPLKEAIFTEENFRQFSVGQPSLAFGKAFRPFDSRFIARLPGVPYQFVNRIVSADHPFLETKAGGWVEAQYDVPANAWYFKANKTGAMPFCVINEIALQVCGWVSSYAGSSRHSSDPLYYRNLGGTSVLRREITPQTGRITIKVRMTKSSEAGGLIIQSFDMKIEQKGEVIYEGTTTFGFFTKQALADQVGIRGWKSRIWLPEQENTPESLPIQHPLSPYDENLEQSGSLELPAKALLMLDSFAWYPQGGSKGLGAAVGRKKIDPKEWFFTAHFFQDPVMPGSLGLEAFLQVLKAAALKLWPHLQKTHRFSAITAGSPHTWLYRGQVTRANSFTTARAEITEIHDGPEPYLKARGFLQADDLTIYELQDFGIALLKS
ncbi:hypothetical protein IJT93_11570 [bacterium]|nr:hypothetical protein [bacterium]